MNNITSLIINCKCEADNLDFLKNCANLKTLTFNGGNIGDISGISKLTELTSIDLSNNRIKNLYPLKNLNKLESLILSNNIIDDIDFTVDGETDKQNNLRILSDLNQSGKLTKLYLDGNTGITDFSVIEKLNWSEKKGF